MFKVVYHRHHQRFIKPFDTKDAAMNFGKMGSDYNELFFEYLLDENDIIIYDGTIYVFGLEDQSDVGKKFVYTDEYTIETE
ncbi:hypothetical protein RY280_23405 [Bacillus paralicheniformis]|uniref:hypothetical protein n=1 Tax=Bacillus paralicheniformis TaxID=1648923 RepID=UPI0020418DBA|nr:hypothetical protein [Bacillus paralicheniformis]MCM3425537.1 hypothetical protein [Bacillus paralicheniformis]